VPVHDVKASETKGILMIWVLVIFVSALLPIIMALNAEYFSPLVGVDQGNWLGLIGATLPLWFSLVVLSVQQLAEKLRDKRRLYEALIERHDADTDAYNAAFMRFSNSLNLKMRTLRQAVAQIEDVLNEGPASEVFGAWRGRLKKESLPSNCPDIRAALRDVTRCPGFLFLEDSQIRRSPLSIAANSKIPAVDKVVFSRDEEIIIARLAQDLVKDSVKKNILLAGAGMLSQSADSSVALDKFNNEVHSLSLCIRNKSGVDDIKDCFYGVALSLLYLIEVLALEISVEQEAHAIFSDIYGKHIERQRGFYPVLKAPLQIAEVVLPEDVNDYLDPRVALNHVGLV